MTRQKNVPTGYDAWPSYRRFVADYAPAFNGWRLMLLGMTLPRIQLAREPDDRSVYGVVLVTPYLLSRRLDGAYRAEVWFGDRFFGGGRWRLWVQVEEKLV